MAANIIRGFGTEAAAGGPDQDLLDALSDVMSRSGVISAATTGNAVVSTNIDAPANAGWPS